MTFFSNMVGRKILMAVTGVMMIFFLVVHFLGNTSIFGGPDGINAYAAMLQGLGPFIWAFRFIMVAVLLSHVIFGVMLFLENRKARPVGNVRTKQLSTTFAAQNMIWTGLVIGIFITYHLLHFTFHVTNPDTAAGHLLDAAGRPDVFRMIVLSFQKTGISLVYAVSLTGLALHLSHGIQSLFQTLGLVGESMLPFLKKAGTYAALLFLIGYVSIPLAIFLGFRVP